MLTQPHGVGYGEVIMLLVHVFCASSMRHGLCVFIGCVERIFEFIEDFEFTEYVFKSLNIIQVCLCLNEYFTRLYPRILYPRCVPEMPCMINDAVYVFGCVADQRKTPATPHRYPRTRPEIEIQLVPATPSSGPVRTDPGPLTLDGAMPLRRNKCSRPVDIARPGRA